MVEGEREQSDPKDSMPGITREDVIATWRRLTRGYAERLDVQPSPRTMINAAQREGRVIE